MHKCGEMDSRLSENLMPYYPTEEPWTHVLQPAKVILHPTLPVETRDDTWKTVERRQDIHRQSTLQFNTTQNTQHSHDPTPSNTNEQSSPTSNANATNSPPPPTGGT